MAKFWYSGDVNVEHGGTWFAINKKDWDDYGYCSAVRVTPCSDAGAQENAWWIEELTVIKPENDQKLKSVLDTCGWLVYSETGDIISSHNGDIVAKKGTAAFRRVVAEACVGYGKYDVSNSETVQIGKDADSDDLEQVEPDTVLRANSSLERYVKRQWLSSLS